MQKSTIFKRLISGPQFTVRLPQYFSEALSTLADRNSNLRGPVSERRVLLLSHRATHHPPRILMNFKVTVATMYIGLLESCHLFTRCHLKILKSISSAFYFRDKEWQGLLPGRNYIERGDGRDTGQGRENEGHFPHRRYHCTWETAARAAEGEREEAISQIEKLR